MSEGELQEIAERVEQLSETTAALRDLGEAADVPAVEYNARRIEGVLAMLEAQVPPELLADGGDSGAGEPEFAGDGSGGDGE